MSAAIRVSERRARLLGLDEPTATKTEISGSLSVDAARRLKAETEDLQRWLTFEELRELGEKSERLFADARALVQARRTPMLIASRLRLPRTLMTSWRASRPSSPRLQRSLTNGMRRVPKPLRQIGRGRPHVGTPSCDPQALRARVVRDCFGFVTSEDAVQLADHPTSRAGRVVPRPSEGER